jgi:RND family efflux transporter MFP subunit
MTAKLPALLAALLGLGLLTGCGEGKQKPPTLAVSNKTLGLTVQLQTLADLKPVSAIITSRDEGLAKARISGTLLRLNVKEGDTVQRGQVLGEVRDERLIYQTEALNAQTRAVEAELARAEADLARVQTLYNSGIYAKARLDQSLAAAKAARANLAAAKAQAASGAELGRQGAILAPANGKVLHAPVPVGTVVMAGQTIVEITAGAMIVRLDLPEAQATSLITGALVMLVPNDAPPIEGRVLQVYPSVTDGQVRADIAASGLGSDLAGQSVRALVRVGERQAITLPRAYIANRYGLDFVRLLAKDGKASDVTVQTAPTGLPGQVEILSGLVPGDRVLLVEAAQ